MSFQFGLNQVLALALVASSVGLAAQGGPPDIDTRVDVGGYSLHITCAGSGSPTVILEAGLGATARTWQKVIPEVSKITRVCSYDRPNLGQSDPAPRAVRRIESTRYIALRSGQETIGDLQRLLAGAGESGPYVLAGHSIGGGLAMLFADQHDAQVVGLVLVASVHPDQVARLQSLMTASEAKVDQGGLDQNREGFDIEGLLDEVRAATWRSTLPLRVLTEGRPDPAPTERSRKEAAVWREMQTELSRRSENGKLIVAEKSGHDIQLDQPELVIAAIRELVGLARVSTGR
jgi:pimeloyl-ACP methyl ester carboxylesterase